MKLGLLDIARVVYYTGSKVSSIVGMGKPYLIFTEFLVSRLNYFLTPNPLKVNGSKLYWDKNNFATAFIISRKGGFEKEVSKLFSEVVKPGMSVVDIGANIGIHTLQLARLVGSKGIVVAIEPIPDSYNTLCRNIHENKLSDIVVPMEVGVSDRVDHGTIFLGRFDLSCSSRFKNGNVTSNGVGIEFTTLDNLLREHKVDFIKMDIEGGEGYALRGMSEVSKVNPNLMMVMEFNYNALKVAGTTISELFYCLKNLGFTRVSFVGERLKSLDFFLSNDIATLIQGHAETRNLFITKG